MLLSLYIFRDRKPEGALHHRYTPLHKVALIAQKHKPPHLIIVSCVFNETMEILFFEEKTLMIF
jgi:hypothetical protein